MEGGRIQTPKPTYPKIKFFSDFDHLILKMSENAKLMCVKKDTEIYKIMGDVPR